MSLKRSLSINQFIYHPNCPLYNISTDWFYGSDSCFIVEKLKGLKEKHKNVVTATINHYWRLSKYVTYVTSCHFCRHESQNQTFFGGNYRWQVARETLRTISVLRVGNISHFDALSSFVGTNFTAVLTGVGESFSLTWYFFSSSVTVGLNMTQSVTVCTSTSWSAGWLSFSGLAFSPNQPGLEECQDRLNWLIRPRTATNACCWLSY